MKTVETKILTFSKMHTKESGTFHSCDQLIPLFFLMYHQSSLISMNFLAQRHVYLKFQQSLVTECENQRYQPLTNSIFFMAFVFAYKQEATPFYKLNSN